MIENDSCQKDKHQAAMREPQLNQRYCDHNLGFAIGRRIWNHLDRFISLDMFHNNFWSKSNSFDFHRTGLERLVILIDIHRIGQFKGDRWRTQKRRRSWRRCLRIGWKGGIEVIRTSNCQCGGVKQESHGLEQTTRCRRDVLPGAQWVLLFEERVTQPGKIQE